MLTWPQIHQALIEASEAGLSATEVVRRMAIEEESAGNSWERVGAIYYAGLAMGGYDLAFVRSMAVSALGCLQDPERTKTVHLAAHTDAEWAVGQLIMRESPATADSLYLKACIVYWSAITNLFTDTSLKHDILRNAVFGYREAIAMDPTHWLAHYFLTCCLFDLQCWPDVLAETSVALGLNNGPANQPWRRSKLQEWQIVGLFNVCQVVQAQGFLAQFLDQFAMETPTDLEGKIESLDELADCLQQHEVEASLKTRFEAFKSSLEAAGVI
ncbi:hypothetical protein [Prosthecobacter fusiformis]|nr:hypothetical protein [Prosthecobacter fusiformis]